MQDPKSHDNEQLPQYYLVETVHNDGRMIMSGVHKYNKCFFRAFYDGLKKLGINPGKTLETTAAPLDNEMLDTTVHKGIIWNLAKRFSLNIDIYVGVRDPLGNRYVKSYPDMTFHAGSKTIRILFLGQHFEYITHIQDLPPSNLQNHSNKQDENFLLALQLSILSAQDEQIQNDRELAMRIQTSL